MRRLLLAAPLICTAFPAPADENDSDLATKLSNPVASLAVQWTVPINLTLSHLIRFEKRPVSFQLAGRYYAEHPDDTAIWGVRAAIVLLSPE